MMMFLAGYPDFSGVVQGRAVKEEAQPEPAPEASAPQSTAAPAMVLRAPARPKAAAVAGLGAALKKSKASKGGARSSMPKDAAPAAPTKRKAAAAKAGPVAKGGRTGRGGAGKRARAAEKEEVEAAVVPGGSDGAGESASAGLQEGAGAEGRDVGPARPAKRPRRGV